VTQIAFARVNPIENEAVPAILVESESSGINHAQLKASDYQSEKVNDLFDQRNSNQGPQKRDRRKGNNFFMDQMNSQFEEALNADVPALTNALKTILEIPDENDERYQAAFGALLELPVDPLERELLDAFQLHAPAIALTAMAKTKGLSPEHVRHIIAYADTDGDGEISVAEATAAEHSVEQHDLRQMFSAISAELHGGSARARIELRRLLASERVALFKDIVPRINAAKQSTGQDVVPLAALHLEYHELWRVYLPMAMIIDDLATIHAAKNSRAFIVGINAPPGSGKSTLVQLLKFLLIEIAAFENQATPRRCIEVSQDDFYRTKTDRQARGVTSRMEMDGMDSQLCANVLTALATKNSDRQSIEVPRFNKAKDDRESQGTLTQCGVDIILFEGWRVGIDHPNYAPLIDVMDFLLCLKADLAIVKQWKFEQVRRDAQHAGVAFDADALEQAWHERILPVVDEYSDRVRARANLVLNQGAGHMVEAMHGRLHTFTHITHPDYHEAGTNALEIF
jgi:uridine kinase